MMRLHTNDNLPRTKALEIADKFRIVETAWIVPGQSSAKKYAVRIVGSAGYCTCPDVELRREAYKHVLAVRFLIQREQNPDGSTTVTETFEVTKRTTYPQKWTEYNQRRQTKRITSKTGMRLHNGKPINAPVVQSQPQLYSVEK